jgi:hypothetical protein
LLQQGNPRLTGRAGKKTDGLNAIRPVPRLRLPAGQAGFGARLRQLFLKKIGLGTHFYNEPVFQIVFICRNEKLV